MSVNKFRNADCTSNLMLSLNTVIFINIQILNTKVRGNFVKRNRTIINLNPFLALESMSRIFCLKIAIFSQF